MAEPFDPRLLADLDLVEVKKDALLFVDIMEIPRKASSKASKLTFKVGSVEVERVGTINFDSEKD